MTARDDLIDAVTREVLLALAVDLDGVCDNCGGSCAAHCPDKVRTLVANGADRISYQGPAIDVPRDLARYIDHTLLRPDATADEIDQMCAEAIEHGFASVCVNPTWVRRVSTALRGSDVDVCSVVGFPLGSTPPEIKAMEARRAIRDGADEVDMVLNIGALKSHDHDLVYTDIAKVVDACRESGVVCKVIIEAALLTDEEKVIASHLARRAKADFVKTSTGFGPGGATVEDVLLMRETVGPEMGVKASGGIHTTEEAEDMIAAGATRIGASAGIAIVTGGGGSEQY